MRKHMIFLAVLTMCAVLMMSGGCGGGKKKDKQGKPEGKITGIVDLFSGFGADPAFSSRAKELGRDAIVKVYRMQSDGSGLAPLSEVPAAPLTDGAFSIDKLPIGERNLVARVETPDGKAVISALVPVVSSMGGNLIISPETDIEAAIFMNLAENGIREKGDVQPKDIDVSLIREIISPEMFFDLQSPPPVDSVIKALIPIVKTGYSKYIQGLLGAEGKPGDEAIGILLDFISAPMMKIQSAYERGETPLPRDMEELETQTRAGAEEAGLFSEALSAEAVAELSRRQSLYWMAKCLSKPAEAPGCPAREKDAPDLSDYGRIVDASLSEKWAAGNLDKRVKILFPAETATSTRRLPPTDTIRKILNVPDSVIEPFRTAALEIAGGDMNQRDRDALKVVLANYRDTILTGVFGLDPQTALQSLSAAFMHSQALAGVLKNAGATVSEAGQAHRSFTSAYDAMFQPVTSAIRSKYTKLEESDISKVTWAVYEVVLLTTLHDIPSVLFTTSDTDEDGVADNVERLIGTDPADDKSAPPDALTATPAGMLPPQPPDSDKDGYFDSVEKIAGTDPENQASKPAPGMIKFCSTPGPVCPMPVSKITATNSYSIAGTVTYDKKPAAGFVAGIYSRPEFLGRQPDAIAENTTGDDGGFNIKTSREGKYFVVAFRDLDGDGRPGTGEVAGYSGGDFPARVKVGEGAVQAKADVVLRGAAGGARCEPGKFHDPSKGACVSSCSGGFEADALTGECRCEKGKMFVEPDGTCGEKCPEGTVNDVLRGGCYCPKGSIPDREKKVCACPAGMYLDAGSNVCKCEKGLLHRQTMTCMDRCPATFVEDGETGSCECPDGAVFDKNVIECVCSTGMLDENRTKCVKACGGGMKPDVTGKKCRCPEKEKYDEKRGECVCAEGLERLSQGGCGVPKEEPPAGKPAEEPLQDDAAPEMATDTEPIPDDGELPIFDEVQPEEQ